jgi:peptidoglycan/LPS O-acetylase OafA/YrhL
MASPPVFRIPAIDGLRAVAVMAVLLCHAQFAAFAGGYVGVDVFFVISGYVVSLLILREQEQGGFSLPAFYARRLKRLAPALLCVLGASLAFALLFCFPENVQALAKNIGFVSLFYSNVYLARQTGYFDPAAEQQPLLHTWSLSVEEQFYLLIPLLLVLLRRLGARTRVAVLAALCLASLAYSQHAVSHHVPGAFYYLQTRAFEFLLGMLLACLHAGKPAAAARSARDEVLALAGLGLIAWTVLAYRAATPMPGWQALLPCVGAVLVIAGARSRLAGMVLANPLALYIGKISYVLYLWHWPVMFALRRLQLDTPGWMAAAIGISFALAVPTHHWLEQPLRRLAWSPARTGLALFLLPVLLAGGLVALGKQTQEFSRFYAAHKRQDYLDAGLTVFKTPRAARCWSKEGVTPAADCTLGDSASPDKAVLWGDSHAYHLVNFIDQLGKDYRLAVHDMSYTMCAPIEHSPATAGDPAYQGHAQSCRAHDQAVMQHILADPAIRTVLMSAAWDVYINPASGADAPLSVHGFQPQEIDRQLAATIARLHAAGKRVVLFDDVPLLPPGMESCVSNRLYLPHRAADRCTFPVSAAQAAHQPVRALLDGVARQFPQAGMVHIFDLACTQQACGGELLGTPLYAHGDRGHLGAGGSAALYRAYRERRPDELASVLRAPPAIAAAQ